MSQIKRLMEKQEEQERAARRIALDAKVLTCCPFHDCVYNPQNFDNAPAYKLANFKFSKGLLTDLFDDRREMTDTIKDVIQDAPLDCYECDRQSSED